MTLVRRSLLLGLVVVCAGLLAGCAGYRAGGGYEGSIRTAAVRLFENETYELGLQATLTEALAKEIQRATPWRLVSPEAADAVLSGVITEHRLETISIDSESGLSEEIAVRITLNFEWRDQRAGRPLIQRQRFSAVGSFVPAVGVGQRIETGQRGAVQELARDIVDLLRSDW